MTRLLAASLALVLAGCFGTPGLCDTPERLQRAVEVAAGRGDAEACRILRKRADRCGVTLPDAPDCGPPDRVDAP